MIAVVGLGVLGARVVQRITSRERLLFIDYDFVSESNVPKQYPEEFVGRSKVEVARELYHPNAEAMHTHLDSTTVGVLADASLVIDCTDNLLARRIINDFCTREGIPWIHAALSDTAGSVATFFPGEACFTCVYPQSTGEICTPNLDVRLADKAADAVIEAIEKIEKGIATFIRITKKDAMALEMTKRDDCPTCAGSYPYLQPKKFYITFCTNSNCMAAKPAKHVHDHGKPRELIIEGMPLELFPNGEIHFGIEADDDVLYLIAEKVYSEHVGKR